jgi:hypothetical protein
MARKVYKIPRRAYDNASRLGVIIKPSKTGYYKIDVYNIEGDLIYRIGDIRYKDYHIYRKLERQGKVHKGTADMKRKAYEARHEEFRKDKWRKSYYSDQILWK